MFFKPLLRGLGGEPERRRIPRRGRRGSPAHCEVGSGGLCGRARDTPRVYTTCMHALRMHFCPRPASTGWRAARWPPRSGCRRHRAPCIRDYDAGFCAFKAQCCASATVDAPRRHGRPERVSGDDSGLHFDVRSLRWSWQAESGRRRVVVIVARACESVHFSARASKTDVAVEDTYFPRKHPPSGAPAAQVPPIYNRRPLAATQTPFSPRSSM